MLRKLSVRGKILAALAVPVLVLGLAATLFSLQAFQAVRVASQAEGVAGLLPYERSAVDAIAIERDLAVQTSAGTTVGSQLTDAEATTDKMLADLTTQIEKLDTSALDPSVQLAIDRALGKNAEDLAVVRGAAKTTTMTPIDVARKYTDLTTRLLAIPSALSSTLTDRQLAMDLNAYVATLHALDQVRLEAPIVQMALDDIAVDPVAGAAAKTLGELPALIGEVNAARANAATQVATLADSTLVVPEALLDYKILHRQIVANDTAGINSTAAAGWVAHNKAEVDTLVPLVSALEGRSVDAAAAETSSRETTALYTLVATALTVFVSVAVALLISRRITVPLRRLTDAAGEVRAQLPQLVEQVSVPGQGPKISLKTITVESSDEVGQLAAAFNDVNHTTVEVAQEQAALRGSIAEMFVNVARRDHVLLNRQLAFLDELERSEEDATTLANLFRLDHLATRMRRNSESLLVLAGIDSGRRVRQNMPISDVVRTASSEIELYDRVRLNLEADPLMLGHNALNAAHLLAELLENATMFSEPNTPVEVTTTRTARTVNVEVRDHGLGMSPQDIEEANAKIASRSAADVIGVQHLGLFVVGRLTERLGAQVTFSRNTDGSSGTVVTLALPATLFAGESGMPTEASPDSLTLAERPFESEQQAGEQGWTLPEVEPEDAYPVDIDALTDGETSQGMPRRRTSAPAQMQDLPSDPVFGSVPDALPAMVLPPLESADPTIALTTPDDLGWAPPVTPLSALSARLPSRSRFEAPVEVPVEPVLSPATDVPVLDEEKRSAMFSSFRTLGSVETDQTMTTDNSRDQAAVTPEAPTAEDLPSFVLPTFEPEGEPWHPEPAPGAELGSDDLPTYAPAADSDEWTPEFGDLPTFGQQPTTGGWGEPAAASDPGPVVEDLPTYQPEAAFDRLPTFRSQQVRDDLASVDQSAAFEPERPFSSNEQTGAFEQRPTGSMGFPESEPMFPSTAVFASDFSFAQDEGSAAPAYEPVQAFEPLASTGRPHPAEPAAPLSDSLLSQLSTSAPQAFEATPVYEPTAPFDPRTAFEPATPFSDLDPEVIDFVAFADRRSSNDLPEEAFAPRGMSDGLPEPTFGSRRSTNELPEPAFGGRRSTNDLPDDIPWTPPVPIDEAQPVAGLTEAVFELTLPSFADLVADAPTRRSAREEPSAKRGLFGRKKRRKVAPAPLPAPAAAFPTFTRSTTTGTPAETEPFAPFDAVDAPRPQTDDVFTDQRGYEEQNVSAWTPSTPVPVVESTWAPLHTPYDDAPVPLRDLPLSGLDAGDRLPSGAGTVHDSAPILAMRSAIQEQALAELSQLSAYRPATVESAPGDGLQRRTRSQVAESTDDLASQTISRDAAELRSRLSAFQSATSRGRQVPSAPAEGYGGAADS